MKLGPQPPTTTITNHDHTTPHQLTTQKNIDIFDLATDANIYCVVSESFPKYYALLVLFRRLKIPEYQRNVFLSPFCSSIAFFSHWSQNVFGCIQIEKFSPLKGFEKWN